MTDAPMPGTPLDLPLPPALAETFGYPGDARYLTFHIGACTDDLIYDDGSRSGSANTWAFGSYRRHRAVEPLLRGFNLGYCDLEAEHVLVIDREKQRASVARPEEAAAFLDAQWPPREPVTAEQAEAARLSLDELLDPAGWRQEAVDMQRVYAAMEEQRRRVSRMASLLDMCPTPPGRGR